MKTKRYSPFLALALAALVAGCNPGTHVSTGKGNVTSDGKVITLRADGHPEAKISASGELTIDGKAVALNEAQRVLLQSYLKEMNAMTADGIAIGKQGAALAGTAMTEAIKGAIKGDGKPVDEKIEAEAKKIEQQAMRLCKRLVTIKASQDALAAQLPAFQPYATIDDADVNDCGSKNDSYAAGKEVGGSVARALKEEKDSAANDGQPPVEPETPAASDTSKQ